jgi:hypothetical protein
MLYCMIELRETFWFIVEQMSMCIGNGSGFSQTIGEEADCLHKIMCTRTKRVPSDDLDEEFIQKMSR